MSPLKTSLLVVQLLLTLALMSVLLLAACGPADPGIPSPTVSSPPAASAEPTRVGLVADNDLPPEKVPGAVLATLPTYPGAEEPPGDAKPGYATSPMVSVCHREECPEVHTASRQWIIEANGEAIEAWYWDQLVPQGYRNSTGSYGMSGGRSHSSIVFFHPDRPDVNVQLHFYPQGDGVTVLDTLVVYLEPLPKPNGPVIPRDAERVEIDYWPKDTTHVITEPAAVQRLAAITNNLPVRPSYSQSCPIGREESGAKLTFVTQEDESWEVRIVNPGCPYRVELTPYPPLQDTRGLLWEAVQEIIGEREPYVAGPWPGRPTPPTRPPMPTSTPPEEGQGSHLPADAPKIVHANNRFAFDLLAELQEQEDDQNLFFSPLSVSLALAMTYNGAAGETQRAMAETLHLAGMDRDSVNRDNAALLAALAEREPDLELGIANSIWAREGSNFHQAFFDRVSQDYKAEVDSLVFDNAAKERINGWVSEQTNGKIDSILDEINPNDVMYLINAIYFKASWWYVFREEDTREGTFHNADGSEVEVPMMHQDWAKYDYLDGDGFAALRLRYRGDASMYIFLPDQDSSLSEFLGNLDGDAWSQWMQDFRQQGGGDIILPRFEIEYDATLNDALKALGMGVAFSPGADFSDMGPGVLAIDRVVHKAVVEVHEKGTEAAAATMAAMFASGPQFTFEFVADRPFFFAITDDRTGSILFIGTVYELGG